MMRCLLSGERHRALEALAEVREQGSLTGLLLLWAATLNGRVFHLRPRYLEPFTRGDGSRGVRPWQPGAQVAPPAREPEATAVPQERVPR